MSEKPITAYFGSASGSKRKHDEVEEDTSAKEEAEKKLKKIRDKISALAKMRSALYPNIGLSWFKALEPEFHKEYFSRLGKWLATERRQFTVLPPEKEVYFWTNTCKIQDVKVVILGQDPYYSPHQAHGLAFSVRRGIPIPPSLANIYKELSADIPEFKQPSHGFLLGWASQGVLLLNSVLTVRSGLANSHHGIDRGGGWEKFTEAVITWISDNIHNVVFMLWGGNAKQKLTCIKAERHLILIAAHPSPLSAHRGFFGCRHFSKANAYLEKNGKKPIDWSNLP